MEDVWNWVIFFVVLIALAIMIIFQNFKSFLLTFIAGLVSVIARKGQNEALILVDKLTCLADLEFDYINPYDTASRMNSVVLPEYITQGVLTFVFLLTGHWVMSLFSIPYLYYNVRLYLGRQHLIDVTEIFNLLDREKKQWYVKLGYNVLLLLMCLFWIIYNALEDDDYLNET